MSQDNLAPKNFAGLCEDAFEMLWSQKNNQSSTRSILNHLIEFMPNHHMNITTQSCDGLVRHLREKGLKPRTINNYLNILSQVLTFAHERKWIRHRPKITREPEEGAERRHFSPEEMDAIHDALPHRYGMLFRFLCDTGLRMGEALSLTWKDIEIEESQMSVRKRKHPQSPVAVLPLSPRALRVLIGTRFWEDADLRYDHGPFTQMTYAQCRHAWDLMRKALNVDPDDTGFVWHGCRHTFCSRLVQRGVNLAVVKELARHKDIKTTLMYAHLDPSNLRDAILCLDDHGDTSKSNGVGSQNNQGNQGEIPSQG